MNRLRISPVWDRESLDVEAFIDHHRVGHAACVFDPETGAMRICDLTVLGPEKKLIGRLKRFLRWGRWSMQGIRIGSKLLDGAIEHARQGGMRLLHGAIVKGDLAERPWLTDFYRRHGFQVVLPNGDPHDPAGTEYRIELVLGN